MLSTLRFSVYWLSFDCQSTFVWQTVRVLIMTNLVGQLSLLKTVTTGETEERFCIHRYKSLTSCRSKGVAVCWLFVDLSADCHPLLCQLLSQLPSDCCWFSLIKKVRDTRNSKKKCGLELGLQNKIQVFIYRCGEPCLTREHTHAHTNCMLTVQSACWPGIDSGLFPVSWVIWRRH